MPKCPFVKLLIISPLLLLGFMHPALAHPHVWVDYYVDAVSSKEGITKLKFRWHFDDMFTSMVEEDFNIKSITPKNVNTLRDSAFSNLKNYHYYTYIKFDGKEFEPKEISDFGALLKGKNLEYTFTIILPHPAKEVELSLYDPEFYVDIGPPMLGAESDSVGIMSSATMKPKPFITTSSSDGAKAPTCEYHAGQPRVSQTWGAFAVYVVNCHAST